MFCCAKTKHLITLTCHHIQLVEPDNQADRTEGNGRGRSIL